MLCAEGRVEGPSVHSRRAEQEGICIRVLSYVDDTYVQVDRSQVARAMVIIAEALSAMGWQLQRSKCKAWIRNAEAHDCHASSA